MKFIILSIFLLLSSCSNSDKKVESLAIASYDGNQKQCIDLLKTSETKVVSKVGEGVGIASSYLLSGVAGAADVVAFIASGVAVGIVLCGPFVMIDGQVHSKAMSACSNVIQSYLYQENGLNFSAAKAVYSKTTSWRCPDFSSLALRIRKVSDCLKGNGQVEDARKQLALFLDSPAAEICLKKKDEVELRFALQSIEQ